MSFREKKKSVENFNVRTRFRPSGVLLMIGSSEICMYNFKASTVCSIGICVKGTRDLIVKLIYTSSGQGQGSSELCLYLEFVDRTLR